MTTLREAAQQALEALEHTSWRTHKGDRAIIALRAALAQEQAEPAPTWKPWKPVELVHGCQVCGIGANGETMGYVCTRGDCPTRVTYGGAV